MTLRWYADKLSTQYRTAWNHFKTGAYKHPTGTIIVPDTEMNNKTYTLYCRVSSSQNKNNLESPYERVSEWSIRNGLTISYAVKEVGSGLNDSRKKLLKLLDNPKVTHIIVEHKDRLTRFGSTILTAY